MARESGERATKELHDLQARVRGDRIVGHVAAQATATADEVRLALRALSTDGLLDGVPDADAGAKALELLRERMPSLFRPAPQPAGRVAPGVLPPTAIGPETLGAVRAKFEKDYQAQTGRPMPAIHVPHVVRTNAMIRF